MNTIPAILRENVGRWPDRAAIIATKRDRDRQITFSELETAAANFAGKLSAAGIRPGDAVLVFVPMSIELYVSLLGIIRLGAAAIFLDPSAGLAHINACCEMLPPAGFVGPWPLRAVRPFVRGLRRIPKVFAPPGPAGQTYPNRRDDLRVVPGRASGSKRGCGGPVSPQDAPPDDPALITFTSGSTGRPKAAVRTHRFLVSQHEALRDSIDLQEGEVDLTTLPIFVLANLASGITSVLPDGKISRPGFIDPEPVARQIARLKPTRTGGSPAFYQRLADRQPGCLTGFRKIYTGGAPVFPALLQRLQTCAPVGNVVAVYGSTEAEPIAHIACKEIHPDDWNAMQSGKGLLAGFPIPQTKLRVIADQWGGGARNFDSLPPGDIGEIVVTGAHVLKGYLHGRGDEETKVRRAGEIWHRTGDAGYLDTQGRLWLMGRCSARVRDRHGLLYPFAVECVAMTFDFVRRAAFVSLNGNRLLAVEPKGRLSSEAGAQLEARLAWAHLAEIRTLPRIPVDARHNSKVNYPTLMKLLSKRR